MIREGIFLLPRTTFIKIFPDSAIRPYQAFSSIDSRML